MYRKYGACVTTPLAPMLGEDENFKNQSSGNQSTSEHGKICVHINYAYVLP